MSKPLRVQIKPLRSNQNAYPGNFSAALERSGATLVGFDLDLRTHPAPNAIIIHWPNDFFVRHGRWHTLHFLAYLLSMKARGARLVWVVHNIAPHNKRSRPTPRMRRIFFRLLDGLIFLSAASREVAVAHYPELSRKPFLVTAHGHYAAMHHPPSLPTGIAGERSVVLGSFGQVRPYKGLDHLARLAANLPHALVAEIAGACPDTGLASDLLGIAEASSNIRADLRFLSDQELEDRLDRVDAVVLPYREILNSGSALHALSRYRPVLAPRLGSLPELQGEVGSDWLTLYDAPLKQEDLLSFAEHVRSFTPSAPPDLHRQDWDNIGAAVHAFLSGLIRSPARIK